ncbi:neurochondrin-like [Mytilus californianus]|uniref:neurochondrin-like n=1 Tax=Mytilus californianus TaxID=6549 RepID=UPI002247DC56|nr:neurochondrin-like [Mytilus californianus]
MATSDDKNIRKTFSVLENAKTDNERFAALLLFAKTTNAKQLSLEDRKRALDAIGVTFFNRLLKSKNIPEDCEVDVYRSLALKILSGLCGDNQLVLEFEVYKILRSINDIITDSDSQEDMIIDCYDLLSAFAQTEEGSIKLVDYGTVTALSEVITKHLPGCEKGQVILQSVLHLCGDYAWKKDTPSMQVVLEHFCNQLETFQDERKFELCAVVSGIVSSLPKDVAKKSLQRTWFKSLVHALADMFTSKLGQPQRDPALRLASSVLDKLGVESILPPNRDDCKLLLVIIHLSCIEVRISLENLTPDQIMTKADTLVSCYNLLELIICHMTSAPSLKLDENQVLQLHSAMEGAFNSVIFYLREQSELEIQRVDPSQIVLASVRVLGSWVAEETSALKARVQEILPFILKLCKCQLKCTKTKRLSLKKKSVKFKSDTEDHSESTLSSELESCTITQETTENSIIPQNVDLSKDSSDNHRDITSDNVKDSSSYHVSDSDNSDHKCLVNQDSLNSDSTCTSSDEIEKLEINKSDQSVCSNSSSSGMSVSGDINIRNVDLIGFLLPGFCHMTAEDLSRKILLDNDLHSVLSLYFKNCVDGLEEKFEEDILRSMETLCGVFLNLVVLEPELIAENEELHKVTQSIFKCAKLISNKEDTLTLWANIITLGVFFLRQQAHVKYDKDDLTKFFSMVVSFIKAPYTSLTVDSAEVLSVAELYIPVWDSIYQLWYLCIQATTSCLPMYPTLVYAMMSTGFLPHIIRLLNKVHGRNVDEDTLLCLIGVITSLVTTEVKAIDVLRSCGGMEFSRLYNCSELEKLIEQ